MNCPVVPGTPATTALRCLLLSAMSLVRCVCRLELKSYRTIEGTPDVDLDVLGTTVVAGMDVEVIDPAEVRAGGEVK